MRARLVVALLAVLLLLAESQRQAHRPLCGPAPDGSIGVVRGQEQVTFHAIDTETGDTVEIELEAVERDGVMIVDIFADEGCHWHIRIPILEPQRAHPPLRA